jgi:YHS domain-containing protein
VTRLLLVVLLVLFASRAAWRLIEGIVEGASGPIRPGPPAQGTAMVRDPICGTWVVPGRAVQFGRGDEARYFCSERCLSQFRARS